MLQNYNGFRRWIVAETPATAEAELKELALLVGIATLNVSVDQWVDNLYRKLDEDANFTKLVYEGKMGR